MAKVDPKQLTRYNVAMGRFAPPLRSYSMPAGEPESGRLLKRVSRIWIVLVSRLGRN